MVLRYLWHAHIRGTVTPRSDLAVTSTLSGLISQLNADEYEAKANKFLRFVH
jgi:hypothetical protein